MKKGLWITALLIALMVAVLLSGVTSAGGVRFDFHIEPGCVVEITPLHYWYKDANGAVHKARDVFTFNLGRASWEVEEPFRTLQGEASYDIDLWCPGIAPTYQGTIHVEDTADGQQCIWFPLEEVELGVFYKGWWVSIDAEDPEY